MTLPACHNRAITRARPPFCPQQPIYCSWKTIYSLNREQPQSPLQCHHVIVVASIAVASTPVTKMLVTFFCGRLGVWNRTAPDRRHLLHVATTKLIMRCVYKLNFRCMLSVPLKITSSTQLWYIRASAGRYVFDGIACLMKVWPLFNREFPRAPMRWRSCTREFQMWRRRSKQIDPHWFQGRQMCFWRLLSTISWK